MEMNNLKIKLKLAAAATTTTNDILPNINM
jgi:hypothetical protein